MLLVAAANRAGRSASETRSTAHVEQRVGQRARDRMVEAAGLGDVPSVHGDLQCPGAGQHARRRARRRPRRSGRGRAGRSRRRGPSTARSRRLSTSRCSSGWVASGRRSTLPRSAASVKAASASSMCSSRARRSQRAQGVGASSRSARTPAQREPRCSRRPAPAGPPPASVGAGVDGMAQLATAYDAGSRVGSPNVSNSASSKNAPRARPAVLDREHLQVERREAAVVAAACRARTPAGRWRVVATIRMSCGRPGTGCRSAGRCSRRPGTSR